MSRRRPLGILVAAALVSACSDSSTGSDVGSTEASGSSAASSAPATTSAPAPTDAPAATDPPGTTAAPATTDPPATTAAPTTTAPPPPGYPVQPVGVPFPTVEWPEAELPADVDLAAIDRAVETAFGAADATARVRSIVVIKGGEIVYERYHPLDGHDVVFDSFSVAKSFTSAMIGQLLGDGELAIDEHPVRPEWQAPGDPRQAITVRQLLQMSSGLEWTEEYGADSLVIEMLGAPDAAAVVAAQPLESEPGSTFEYSTGTTALLAGIAADALGGCSAMDAYLQERLLGPLGITSDQLLTDGGGCWLGGLGANMTTRDFARFGLLYLRGGHWDGRQILPASWVDETRFPASTNPGYGLQWWLAADGQSFSAEGLFGQRVVVVPGADLVIATNSTNGGDPFSMVGNVLLAFGVQLPI